MSLFYHILNEHKELLESKGYAEESLNSPDKPGCFIRQLAIEFSLSKHVAHRHNENQEFCLKAVGFFNHDLDIVVFRFHYQYNPGDLELILLRLEATMANERVCYPLQKNIDLISSTKVYYDLSQRKRLVKAKDIAHHINSDKGRKL